MHMHDVVASGLDQAANGGGRLQQRGNVERIARLRQRMTGVKFFLQRRHGTDVTDGGVDAPAEGPVVAGKGQQEGAQRGRHGGDNQKSWHGWDGSGGKAILARPLGFLAAGRARHAAPRAPSPPRPGPSVRINRGQANIGCVTLANLECSGSRSCPAPAPLRVVGSSSATVTRTEGVGEPYRIRWPSAHAGTPLGFLWYRRSSRPPNQSFRRKNHSI